MFFELGKRIPVFCSLIILFQIFSSGDSRSNHEKDDVKKVGTRHYVFPLSLSSHLLYQRGKEICERTTEDEFPRNFIFNLSF